MQTNLFYHFISGVTLLSGCIAFYTSAHSHGHNHDHAHHHEMTEQERQIFAGYFSNAEVKDRPLSDWQGNWQSVYSYLLAGDLDAVLAAKAASDGTKTFAGFKDYYEKGYATNIDLISIEGDEIYFFAKDKMSSCRYTYEGYKILDYQAGNRGVRYLFQCRDPASSAPKYVQFSDHGIAPAPSFHFHLYLGNESQVELENEVTNWPTFYPLSYDKADIVEEMLAH
ncbi:ZinT/AdcA family metal-binding protein [Utexia brackfieldae]|uniref:ZinT/AdcA family metal-binding protein n=1 Tax=Utexia brackfieldae TaxID=3074108 RepID=UPI00370D7DFF